MQAGLLLGRLLRRHDHLVDMVVIQNHVRVFEVNKRVGAVRIQTHVAVGVLALVAGENNLLCLVRFDLAAGLVLLAVLLPLLGQH